MTIIEFKDVLKKHEMSVKEFLSIREAIKDIRSHGMPLEKFLWLMQAYEWQTKEDKERLKKDED